MATVPKARDGADPTQRDKRSSQRDVANTRVPIGLGHAPIRLISKRRR